jgi:1,4-dihydroxy-2-naphthoate octaprenyltransferase
MLLTLLLVFVAFGSNVQSTLFFIVLGALAIASAVFYTVGSKAYGYKGFGDVFVFVFFGLVSVIGSNYLFVKTIDFLLFLPATAIGMFSVGVLHLNNMRDVSNDTNFGKNTLAVRLGVRKSNAYHVFLILTPIILTLIYAYLSSSPYCYLIVLFLGIPLFSHLKRVLNRHSEKDLDSELKKIAILTFLYACLFGVLINL